MESLLLFLFQLWLNKDFGSLGHLKHRQSCIFPMNFSAALNFPSKFVARTIISESEAYATFKDEHRYKKDVKWEFCIRFCIITS